MHVCILGVHSSIGSHLASILAAHGHRVTGVSRAAEPRPRLSGCLAAYHSSRLEDPGDGSWFRNCDAAVYLAHDPGRTARVHNLEGTRTWYQQARDAGVSRHLFFTSYSAKPRSRSDYGAVKYELETFFRRQNQWLVRPGLVMAPGGMFARMLSMVLRLPLVPLLDGGSDPVPLVSLDSVSAAVERILVRALPAGEWNLHRPRETTMKELLYCMRRVTGSRCRFVPLPSALPLAALRFTEILGLAMPVTADSIAALRENRGLDRPSHLPDLDIREPDLETVLRRLTESPQPGGPIP